MRPEWDEVRMDQIEPLSRMTHCVHFKVGCVFIGGDNTVCTEGYNGPPRKTPHCDEIGCNKDKGGRCRGCHAEVNAVANYSDTPKDLRGATVYLTVFPCHSCAKMLVQLGVRRVVFADFYQRRDQKDGQNQNDFKETLARFEEGEVRVEQWLPDEKKTKVFLPFPLPFLFTTIEEYLEYY